MKRITVLFLTIAMGILLCACGGTGRQAAEPTAESLTWQEQYDMGMRYLSEGKYEEAILAFTAAIEIDPKQVSAYVGRGDARVSLCETEELSTAQADYEQALQIDASNVDAYLGLAEICVLREDIEKAMEILQQGYDLTNSEVLAARLKEIEKGDVIDIWGRTWRISSYDGEGNLMWFQTYTYDEQNRKKSVTCYNGNGEQIDYAEYIYDTNGYLLKGPNGTLNSTGAVVHAEFTRDENGEVIEKTEYDSNGTFMEHIKYQWNSDKTIETTWHYDIDGNVTQHSETTYDELGNQQILAWYDADGNRTSKCIYTYEEGRLESLTWLEEDGSISEKWVERYDDEGNSLGTDFYDNSGKLYQSSVREVSKK